MASSSTRWVLGSTMVALAACSAETTPAPSGAAPPVIGDLSGTGAPAQPAAPAAQPAAPAAPAAQPATGGPAAPAADGDPRFISAAELESFAPKLYCNIPKLSQCSIYGSKFYRLDSVDKFCPQLGGEVTNYCPTENLVARCYTAGDVLVHYYAVGEKPLTKEAAEAKCMEPERKSRIVR